MTNGLLTVGDVEHIQLALSKGKPVDSFVRDLKSATLPAVLEYGCLRWALHGAGLPGLPQAIVASDLGRALGEVNSPLGIKTAGPDNSQWDRLDFRPYGFFVLREEAQLDERDWRCFETLYNLSSTRVGF